jgi:AcrR family transcriptional regulator
MERITRKPTQKRSIEKYENIISAAFRLFNEKGYFNITTTDIAKEAGVATGSLYAYFTDKKDIFIETMCRTSQNFYAPIYDFWQEKGPILLQDEANMKELFHIFIKLMMQYHNFSKLYHDDIEVLAILDEEVRAIRLENDRYREKNTKDVFDIMKIPFKSDEMAEVYLHYCNLLIDDVCHRVLYDNTKADARLYIEQTVDLLYKLLQNVINNE